MEDAKAPWVYKVLCIPGVGFTRGRGRNLQGMGRGTGWRRGDHSALQDLNLLHFEIRGNSIFLVG